MLKKICIFWLPLLLYATLIWCISSTARITPPEFLQFRFWDKVAHCGEYAVLGFLFYRALLQVPVAMKTALVAVVLSSLYGASDEVHQYFVPNRLCTFSDFVADTIGAAIGVWAGIRIRTLQGKKKFVEG